MENIEISPIKLEDLPSYMGASDIARICQCSRQTAGLWIRKSIIPGAKPFGRRVKKVPRANVITFLQEHYPALIASNPHPTAKAA